MPKAKAKSWSDSFSGEEHGTEDQETIQAAIVLVAKGMAETPEDETANFLHILDDYVGRDLKDEVANYVWDVFLGKSPWLQEALGR
jgi:hypothetical protein